MPLFKARKKRVGPQEPDVIEEILSDTSATTSESAAVSENGLPCESAEAEPSAKKWKLLCRMDDPEEEDISASAYPRHVLHRRSVTLPIVLPTIALQDEPKRARSAGYTNQQSKDSSSSTSRTSSPSVRSEDCILEDLETKMALSPLNGFAQGAWLSMDEGEQCDGYLNDDPILQYDVDKLANFKARKKFRKRTLEQIEATLEWTSNPEKFHRCILQLREIGSSDEINAKDSLQESKNENGSFTKGLKNKRVSFAPEILLFFAIEDNLAKDLERVIRVHNLNLRDFSTRHGVYPLHKAVECGSLSCARVLLRQGVDVDAKDLRGKTPLYIAYSNRHFDCFMLLIEAGADVHEHISHILWEFRTAKEKSKLCFTSV
ncbi:predicted protein [Nematostella vectensis]|uniref:Uncharacterized protein n=1 Tax=Nematostella vectensis TaxID=45351 RepID=A7S0J7_NEMVE|nr:uncharacterized protein LOC5514584 [Nematostella vectensis]EDO42745.1 predicted protein [Nematostella vectensis]|eukprot:XP_001634808.1 predicted protein [Nematostella vectensis]